MYIWWLLFLDDMSNEWLGMVFLHYWFAKVKGVKLLASMCQGGDGFDERYLLVRSRCACSAQRLDRIDRQQYLIEHFESKHHSQISTFVSYSLFCHRTVGDDCAQLAVRSEIEQPGRGRDKEESTGP